MMFPNLQKPIDIVLWTRDRTKLQIEAMHEFFRGNPRVLSANIHVQQIWSEGGAIVVQGQLQCPSLEDKPILEAVFTESFREELLDYNLGMLMPVSGQFARADNKSCRLVNCKFGSTSRI